MVLLEVSLPLPKGTTPEASGSWPFHLQGRLKLGTHANGERLLGIFGC